MSLVYRKSSYSGGDGANCVEVATDTCRVHVRDTTNREGFTLGVPADTWRAFLDRVPGLDKTLN